MSIIYYHNPNCSKSRAGLKILEERGINPKIRLYMVNPLSIEELTKIVAKLGMKPRDIIRKKEGAEAGIVPFMSDDEVMAILSEMPRAIERPILEINDKAVIGRPTENIVYFLDEAL